MIENNKLSYLTAINAGVEYIILETVILYSWHSECYQLQLIFTEFVEPSCLNLHNIPSYYRR